MYKTNLDTNINYCTNSDHLLINYIKEMIYKSKKIDVIVAFIKTSGIDALKNEFEYIRDNKIPFRLITGTYLGITDPTAIYKLKTLLNGHGEIKFYSDEKRSFHPKAYFFNTENEDYLYIGSSNLSKTALMIGVEWNYRIKKSNDIKSYTGYENEFEKIFNSESYYVTDEILKSYSMLRKTPKIHTYSLNNKTIGHLAKEGSYDSQYKIAESNLEYNITPIASPKDIQIEALYELNRTRNEGNNKALVVAATGVGKTFLAAFDSKNFKRVLFIAHRNEILKQAYNTFAKIRPNQSISYYNAIEKNTNSNIIIASIQTLNKNLLDFSSDYFDYIVIDEFHHSAANSYQKLLNYFNPKFLLGLTATPDRMDNKDIYAYCDYNVAYEVDLFSAINKGWLSNFHYYGIYDETINYNNISFINGKYIEKELEKSLINKERYNLILKHYKRHHSKQALGFCVNINHAENMAKFFNKMNIPSIAVHSKSNNRDKALTDLKEGNIKIIFAVDIFNEGIDIRSLDTVLMLRPTESSIVFLQQLGRGLRLEKNKKFLTVLDFIGNYKKINLAPILLSGKHKILSNSKININKLLNNDFLPDGCKINFDMQIIDLFEKYNNDSRTIQEKIDEEYFRIKEDLGKVPTRVELFTYFNEDLYQTMRKKSKNNLFRDYIESINRLEKNKESTIYNTFSHKFINMLELTSMNKLYKLPILLSFYNDGNIQMTITDNDISKNFKHFYSIGQHRLDMIKDSSTRNYKNWTNYDYIKLAYRNPIKFLSKTESKFFTLVDNEFILNKKLAEFIKNEEFINQFKDVIEYRRLKFLKDNLLKKEEAILKLLQ
ncbi:DEAD/DEAH box helicase family protein [Helicovermis profundi]|uniref:DEAD/DEAH box helicase family protein n=1 Tax=Helicovermis profundi TaxID=3065157 RepID=A0AAU9E024_9FIRM|nr:DEAD/DEAH box helicase family protein [Clostridia bacterium S502]